MVRTLLFIFFISCASLVSAQNFMSTNSTPTSSVNSDVLKVFPNPTVEYFQVSDNDTARKVSVYTMFGREVKSFTYYPNSQYNVSDLKTGMYIVKITDDNNKVIKAIKLQKNFSGA